MNIITHLIAFIIGGMLGMLIMAVLASTLAKAEASR